MDQCTINFMEDAQTIRVKDKARTLEFEGVLIGESSSAESGKSHWIEIRVFKTSTGRYVIAYIGKTERPDEVDRPTAVVSETAQGAIEALYLQDGSGIRYLTKVARRALTAAAEVDDEIADAFYCEHV